nr:glycosyltransferase [Geotalea sp. SG265]
MADYSRVFRLPREKFCFVPYHTTIEADRYPSVQGDYIFSGGNFARDYATLALAVRGLDIPVVIACSNNDALKGINFPSNVQVVGVSHHRFMELMAGSHINVVCLRKGLLHSGGQQTFLNAMALGKPVIVTDPEGARGYVEDGVDGLLVPAGDPLKLREAILKLLNNRQLALIMGRKGKFRASRLDTEAHLAAIARLARDVALESNMAMEPYKRNADARQQGKSF